MNIEKRIWLFRRTYEVTELSVRDAMMYLAENVSYMFLKNRIWSGHLFSSINEKETLCDDATY